MEQPKTPYCCEEPELPSPLKLQRFHKEGNVMVSDRVHISEDDDFLVCKVMPFSRFYLSAKRQQLTFVSPLTWIDPFDYYFYAPEKLSGHQAFYCLCTCATLSESEEAAWKSYGQAGEPQVRVAYNLRNLIDFVSDIASLTPGLRFYVTQVDYSLGKRDILSEHARFNRQATVSEDELVSYMSIKRKAFSYESEIRIFAVVDDGDASQRLYHIRMEGLFDNFLSKVTLPPYPPFTSSSGFSKTDYESIQRAANAGMKSCIEGELRLNCRIEESRLYMTK